MQQSDFYLLIDTAGLLAVVIMMHLTEEKPMERQQTETVEQHIHAMLNDPNNEEDLTTWSVDDIVADLLAYADLDEEETEGVIRQHVISWKASKAHPT